MRGKRLRFFRDPFAHFPHCCRLLLPLSFFAGPHTRPPSASSRTRGKLATTTAPRPSPHTPSPAHCAQKRCTPRPLNCFTSPATPANPLSKERRTTPARVRVSCPFVRFSTLLFRRREFFAAVGQDRASHTKNHQLFIFIYQQHAWKTTENRAKHHSIAKQNSKRALFFFLFFFSLVLCHLRGEHRLSRRGRDPVQQGHARG